MSLKYSFFFSFSQECFMKEFSSFQERFMSKKIALAFAASCLTAVAAVVPVVASAQDLGSLTDLSSLSVSLFDGPQKQPCILRARGGSSNNLAFHSDMLPSNVLCRKGTIRYDDSSMINTTDRKSTV